MVPPVAKLTDDLMADILSRLPAKPFFQFKCVSKSWLALSSDPCYQNKYPRCVSGLFLTVPFREVSHREVQKDIEYISLSGADDNTIDTTLSFSPRFRNLRIIDCCNGLLLCHSWVGSGLLWQTSPPSERYFVCNPATREWATIPTRGQLLALGFDPRLSHCYHVLNYNWDGEFEIFSSKTGEWAKSQVRRPPDIRVFHTPRAVFLNGIFYVIKGGLDQVVGLDLEGKVCRKIELPGEPDRFGNITHSGGCLHYMVHGVDGTDVWILKHCYHGEWFFKYSVSRKALLEKTSTEYPPSNNIRDIQVLELHPDLDVVFFQVKLKIFSYHLNSGKLKEVCNLKQGCLLRFVFYTPCLTNGISDENASQFCETVDFMLH